MKTCPDCGDAVAETRRHCDCGYLFPPSEEEVQPKPPRPAVSAPDRTLKRDRILFAIVTVYVVMIFVRRLFPTDEIPRPSHAMFWGAIDLALAIGVIGLGLRVLKSVPRGVHGRGKWLLLFVAGIVSLLGILAIHATGGQRVEWEPRPQTSTSALPADVNAKMMRIEELLASYQKADADMAATRWARTSAEKGARELRTLRREDLQEYLARQRAVLDSSERMLQFLSEPGLATDFNRIWVYAESRGLTGGRERPDINPAPWRLVRQLYASSYALNKTVEQNWEEWRLIESPPPEAELKPWQKELRRLAAEATEAQKQLAQLPD